MERIIRLKTRDKRYIKGASYPFIPAQRGMNGVYLTGQLIDPRDEKTRSNLTLEEATGQVVLTGEKRRRFGYIINPYDIRALMNKQELNVSVNDKGTPVNDEDYAVYEMLLLNDHIIAKSEAEYNRTKHIFWLEDVEAVAVEKVSKKRKETLIMAHIFDLDVAKQKDLALLLNVYDTRFKENPDMVSASLLENKIIEQAEKNISVFENVFEKDGGFTKKAIADLMVAKLVHIGQLRINVNEFYYENQFIGNSVEEVQRWMKESKNSHAVTKFSAMLSKAGYNGSETIPVGKQKKTEDAGEEKEEIITK